MIAIGAVLLVITPISWILLHQPQNHPADASVPLVTGTDDKYPTQSTKPTVAPPTTLATTPKTPSNSPTGSPTDRPTNSPTAGRTTAPTQAPTSPGRTTTGRPTPTSAAKSTAPVSGEMTPEELQLFSLIDDARVQNGCARLKQDPNLTTSARSEAGTRASTGKKLNFGAGSSAGAGGDNMTAQQAFDQMMNTSEGKMLNCGLTTLGVGRADGDYETGALCPVILCNERNRVAWVADFS